MNTKQILIAMALVATMTASSAMAQDAAPAPTSDAPAATAPASTDKAAPAAKGKRHKMTFEQRKAKLVDRTEKRLTCIKAAKDQDALSACSSRHKKGGKGRGAKSGASKAAPADAAPAADAPAAQ